MLELVHDANNVLAIVYVHLLDNCPARHPPVHVGLPNPVDLPHFRFGNYSVIPIVQLYVDCVPAGNSVEIAIANQSVTRPVSYALGSRQCGAKSRPEVRPRARHVSRRGVRGHEASARYSETRFPLVSLGGNQHPGPLSPSM